MTSKEKIIKMTKLARLEKEGIEKYRKITEYYIEDYIYKNNFKTRMWVGALGFAIILCNIFIDFQQGANLPSSMQEAMTKYIIPYGIFLVSLLVVYTVLSGIKYRKEYKLAQSKVKEYDEIIESLEELESQDIDWIKVREEEI